MSKFSKQVKRLRQRYDCDWPECQCSGIDTCAAKAEKQGYLPYKLMHDANAAWRESTVRQPRSVDEIQAEQDTRETAYREVDYEVVKGTRGAYVPVSTCTQNTAAILPEGKGGATWYRTYKKPACYHPGLKKIYSIGASDLYVAASVDMPDTLDAALVVQCFASSWLTQDRDAPTLPARYASLAAHVMTKPETIVIPWRDGGIPLLKPSFWGELVRLLPAGKVVFVCQGGHGRSGTALSACLMAHFKGSAKWAIGLTRNAHCDEAIETKVQVEYLESLEAWIKANDPAPTSVV